MTYRQAASGDASWAHCTTCDTPCASAANVCDECRCDPRGASDLQHLARVLSKHTRQMVLRLLVLVLGSSLLIFERRLGIVMTPFYLAAAFRFTASLGRVRTLRAARVRLQKEYG